MREFRSEINAATTTPDRDLVRSYASEGNGVRERFPNLTGSGRLLVYFALPAPVTLDAKKAYYLVSSETADNASPASDRCGCWPSSTLPGSWRRSYSTRTCGADVPPSPRRLRRPAKSDRPGTMDQTWSRHLTASIPKSRRVVCRGPKSCPTMRTSSPIETGPHRLKLAQGMPPRLNRRSPGVKAGAPLMCRPKALARQRTVALPHRDPSSWAFPERRSGGPVCNGLETDIQRLRTPAQKCPAGNGSAPNRPLSHQPAATHFRQRVGSGVPNQNCPPSEKSIRLIAERQKLNSYQ